MKKSDLVVGKHIVLLRYGWAGIYVDNQTLMGSDGYLSLNSLNENLFYTGSSRALDVMSVYDISGYHSLSDISKGRLQTRSAIWIREEIKEVTMAEVEEKFGCKVKIVKE